MLHFFRFFVGMVFALKFGGERTMNMCTDGKKYHSTATSAAVGASAPGVPDASAIAAICEQLRRHVADLGVLYIKLHNYHWHIYGIEFKQVHELLEEYYVSVTEAFDTIAERLLQLGAQAPASMAEYLALSGIAEETEKEITIVSALARVKRDFEYLSTRFSQTQVLAAESGDAVTDGIITDILRTLGKAIWMLGATLKA